MKIKLDESMVVRMRRHQRQCACCQFIRLNQTLRIPSVAPCAELESMVELHLTIVTVRSQLEGGTL